ncbi:MAG TPA: hypothetical protein VIV11_39535 [Kofleriaceae bacterium]
MRALALAAALCGCMPPPNPSMDLTTLRVKREQRNVALVGIAVGLVSTAVGVVLLDRGIELRNSEATADTEGGLGELLVGMMLTGPGVLLAGGSAIAVGVYSHDISKLDDRIRDAAAIRR